MSRDTSFYYSFLVLPPRKRRAIIAVWDFCRAVDDAVDEIVPEPQEERGLHVPDPSEGGLPTGAARRFATNADQERAIEQLALWRAELAACYADEGVDGPRQPRTPQGRALQPVIAEFNLPREPFEGLIRGVTMDLECVRYQTFEALAEYCRHVASMVGLICVEIFGYRDPRTRSYAINLGIALQLTNIVRDVAVDLRRGRIYLPAEDLARFGVTEAALDRGQVTPPVRELLRFQCRRAREYYGRAAADLPAVDARRVVAAEIMGAIYFAILQRIERSDYDVFSRRIRVPRPRRAVTALRVWARTFLGIQNARFKMQTDEE